jgi:hypothetical protein
MIIYRVAIYVLAVGILALVSNPDGRCDDRSQQGDDKQGSSIQQRDPSGPGSPAAANLVEQIFAGLESSIDAVHTGEFSATETSTITKGGKISTNRTTEIKCLFDRRRHCVRYDCVWSDPPETEPVIESRLHGRPPHPKPSAPGKQDDSSGDRAAHHTVVIRQPDMSVLWIAQNRTIILDKPETVYGVAYLRPIDPLAAGFLTASEIRPHSAYAKAKEFLLSRKEKNVTAAADGRRLKLSIHYQEVTPNGSTIETDRKSWVDPEKHFVAVRTEQRQRLSTKGQPGEWTSPQVTEVQWTTMNGVFVPTLIDAAFPIHSNRTLTTTFRLKWIQVNQAVNENVFNYLALGAPKRTIVADRRLDADKPVIVQRIGVANPSHK